MNNSTKTIKQLLKELAEAKEEFESLKKVNNALIKEISELYQIISIDLKVNLRKEN